MDHAQFSADFLKDYEPLALLGSGGMGKVYLGRDRHLENYVAIKTMTNAFSGEETLGQELKKRLANEAKTLARLKHPNIVNMIRLLPEGYSGNPTLVMEYVEGPTLLTLLRKENRFSPERLRQIFVPLAAALGAAHRAGVVHRDLKPGNVMVAADGCITKLLDFSIAKQDTVKGLTSVGSILGTPQYMSPEQIRSESPTPATDVYALGVLLYECASGKPPFDSDSQFTLLRMHMEEAPAPLTEDICPPELGQVILTCLQKKPQDRPRDGTAVLDLLERALPASRYGTPPPLPEGCYRTLESLLPPPDETRKLQPPRPGEPPKATPENSSDTKLSTGQQAPEPPKPPPETIGGSSTGIGVPQRRGTSMLAKLALLVVFFCIAVAGILAATGIFRIGPGGNAAELPATLPDVATADLLKDLAAARRIHRSGSLAQFEPSLQVLREGELELGLSAQGIAKQPATYYVALGAGVEAGDSAATEALRAAVPPREEYRLLGRDVTKAAYLSLVLKAGQDFPNGWLPAAERMEVLLIAVAAEGLGQAGAPTWQEGRLSVRAGVVPMAAPIPPPRPTAPPSRFLKYVFLRHPDEPGTVAVEVVDPTAPAPTYPPTWWPADADLRRRQQDLQVEFDRATPERQAEMGEYLREFTTARDALFFAVTYVRERGGRFQEPGRPGTLTFFVPESFAHPFTAGSAGDQARFVPFQINAGWDYREDQTFRPTVIRRTGVSEPEPLENYDAASDVDLRCPGE